MNNLIKKTFFRVVFTGIFCLIYTLPYAQKKEDSRYEEETITFMNYIRDSVLKIETWATRPYFKQIEGAVSFSTSDDISTWKSRLNNIFTNRETGYILQEMRDTNPFPLTDKMLRNAYTSPETISYDIYQLTIDKFFIEYYTQNKFKVNENCLNNIDVDTSAYGKIRGAKYGDFTKIVSEHATKYNKSIDSIKKYLAKIEESYKYHFAKPVFIKNYKYCILIFSYSNDTFNGSGSVQMFTKKEGKWALYKTLIKRFSTGHDNY